MARPVLTPVLAMAVGPGPLRLTLIGAVVGVTVQLALLPAAPALTLTGRQGAITLMGNPRPRPECPVACRAPPALHGCVSAHKKRRAWATQSVDDNHADVHRDKVGRKQVSGSIPMSKAGSIVVSVEAQFAFLMARLLSCGLLSLLSSFLLRRVPCSLLPLLPGLRPPRPHRVVLGLLGFDTTRFD